MFKILSIFRDIQNNKKQSIKSNIAAFGESV